VKKTCDKCDFIHRVKGVPIGRQLHCAKCGTYICDDCRSKYHNRGSSDSAFNGWFHKDCWPLEGCLCNKVGCDCQIPEMELDTNPKYSH